MVKTESISSKIGNKRNLPIHTAVIQQRFGSFSHDNWRIRNKRIRNWKEAVKLSLFAEDVIKHLEYPKNATRKLLELNIEYGKVAGYKINAQKSLAFLYTKDEILKEKLRKHSLLLLQQKE